MSDSVPVFKRGNQYNHEQYELIFNGELIDKEHGYLKGKFSSNDFPSLTAVILSQQLYEKIVNYSCDEIGAGWNITYQLEWYLNDTFHDFYLEQIDLSTASIESIIAFQFYINVSNWKNSWTLKEQLNNFIAFMETSNLPFAEDDTLIAQQTIRSDVYGEVLPEASYTDIFLLTHPQDKEPLKNVIDGYLQVFTEAQQKILEKYQSSLTISSLTERFNFPPEVKTACEQYLLYFAEFLKDVGIEVTASITEEAENVILAVEPKNKEEALENISQLLNLYLQLPTNPIVNSYQPGSELSFPAQRLQAQVLQLQSQLTLASAERQYLNATIQQQSNLIAQQAQTIQSQQFTTQVLVDSLQKKEEDEEEIVGKIIRVKDYEAGPLAIGLPELIRKLKEWVSNE